ncbi:MAG: DNA-processing protein DprA [Actinomycetota bacterium]|nr:DNA-processing protein DprA [Actinomycetota bacterium]
MSSELPPEAYAAALACFPHMSIHRLGALLRHHPPREAYSVAVGEHRPSGLIERVLADAEVRAAWQRAGRSCLADKVWERCNRVGVRVLVHGAAGYPALLLDDPLPPPVVFAQGDLGLLDGRRAGIVGTRNATAAGRDTAATLGRQLAVNDVHVVSGLARGIDGCAHRGALQAAAGGRPIAVVASGHDVVYPREHQALWRCVAEQGLLLSESPPGTAPEAYRFPLRNRVIAALSEVVVVVESREHGGSLITVNEAIERNVPLMAVPGGVHNRAATGTNQLIRDGAGVVVDATDVLLALAMDHRRSSGSLADPRPRPRGADLSVYETCAGEPRTIDGLALVCSLSLVDAAMAVARLEQTGWIQQSDGWFETVGSPLR